MFIYNTGYNWIMIYIVIIMLLLAISINYLVYFVDASMEVTLEEPGGVIAPDFGDTASLPSTNATITTDDVYIKKQNNNETEFSQQSAITILPHRGNYVVGQQVFFFIKVYDGSSSELAKVNLEVSKDNKSVYETTLLLPNQNQSPTAGPSLLSSGTYLVNATILGNKTNDSAITYIAVADLFLSTPLYFLYLMLAFFIGLIVVIILGLSNQIVNEILRFVFITGIVISSISVLIFTDLSIGSNSPIGLVKEPNSKEWFLNIGGQGTGNDAYKPINIPIYVVVFGLVGGYLRYLYKTAKLKNIQGPKNSVLLFRWDQVPGEDSNKVRGYLKEDLGFSWITSEEFVKEGNVITVSENPNNKIEIHYDGDLAFVKSNGKVVSKLITKIENGIINIFQYTEMKNWLFYHSLEDLSLLFLAPLLAIALWFFLVQGGMTSKLTLALAAFTVGLVTDEVIKLLFSFIRKIVGKAESDVAGESTNGGSNTTANPPRN